MERWQNKVAIVTGASAGIGAACVRFLLRDGIIVVGLARCLELMEGMRSVLPEEEQKRLHIKRCDISKEEDILAAFTWIESKLGGVDVLINNAGIVDTTLKITDPNNTQSLRAIMDTNVMGVVFFTREAFQSMKKRQIDGHIFMFNSIVGHNVPMTPKVNLNLYPPSKYALTAMTEVLRQEFQLQETGIKITSISPAAVDTDMIPWGIVKSIPTLCSEDVADAVIYCLQTPPNVQIHEIIIRTVGGFLGK